MPRFAEDDDAASTFKLLSDIKGNTSCAPTHPYVTCSSITLKSGKVPAKMDFPFQLKSILFD